MLAANIGAGSTVGAAGLGYRERRRAWWWVGSAAIGSVVLALWIGPAMRREAAAQRAPHGRRLPRDPLQRGRPGARVAVLLWVGSLFILAGQLMGDGLDSERGGRRRHRWVGCAIGGAAITVYFAAGGLLTAAWVNVVQLTVKLAGFAVALPLALAAAGGWHGLALVQPRRRTTGRSGGSSAPGVGSRSPLHRAGVHRLAGAAAEDLRRARRSRRARGRRPERARPVRSSRSCRRCSA